MLHSVRSIMFGVLVGVLLASPAAAVLNVLDTQSGKIAVSVDGVGTNSLLGTVDVDKPVGGTVRSAFLACATYSGVIIGDGDLTLDGNPITWDSIVPNNAGAFVDFFQNHVANVGAIVKPKVDAAAAGLVSFTIDEGITNFSTDGCALAVVLDDPAAVTSSAIFLFGGQSTGGDDFFVNLLQPIDLSNPNLRLDMGLGISFGAQDTVAPAGSPLCGLNQHMESLIDVNGVRITSCAGNSDDGVGSVSNGLLFTIGGLGDTNANPSDPFQQPADGQFPRVNEDEVYNLVSFVSDGDTAITVHTLNPSDDDNIFFAWFYTTPPSQVLPENCGNGIDDDGDGLVDLSDSDCQFCGNGVVETPNKDGVNEQCDDGNLVSGDGCSDGCQIDGDESGACCLCDHADDESGDENSDEDSDEGGDDGCDSSCVIVSEAECIGFGGVFQGHGTNCSDPAVCVGDDEASDEDRDGGGNKGVLVKSATGGGLKALQQGDDDGAATEQELTGEKTATPREGEPRRGRQSASRQKQADSKNQKPVR